MRPLILTAFIGVMSCFVGCSAAQAECLSSANAVWNAHPGSHATWRLRLPGHEGEKCWFARGSTNITLLRVKSRVVDFRRRRTDAEAAPQTDGQTNGAGSPVKASQETSVSNERGPSSILMWGTPMRIDPTWDEMFARRERRAE
jgi:hypothetical protein